MGAVGDCRQYVMVDTLGHQRQASLDEVGGGAHAKVNLDIDSRIGRQRDFLFFRDQADRGDIAGRPGAGEQLRGGRVGRNRLESVGANARIRRRQPDVDIAFVIARYDARVAAGGVGFAGGEDFGDVAYGSAPDGYGWSESHAIEAHSMDVV